MRPKILPSTSSGSSDTDSDAHSQGNGVGNRTKKKPLHGGRKQALKGVAPYPVVGFNPATPTAFNASFAVCTQPSGPLKHKMGALKGAGHAYKGKGKGKAALSKTSKTSMKKKRTQSAPSMCAIGCGADLFDQAGGAQLDPWMSVAGGSAASEYTEWLQASTFMDGSDSDSSSSSDGTQSMPSTPLHGTTAMDVWGNNLLEFNSSAIDQMDAMHFGNDSYDSIPDPTFSGNDSWQPTAHIPRSLVSPPPADVTAVYVS